MDIVMRDLDQSNDILGKQRDAAEKRALNLERNLAACEGALRASNARTGAASRMAVEMRIAMARKEGYIDRVRETDAAAIATSVRNPRPGDMLDDVRDAMAVVDESTFGRMVESMSEESLNKVLGKTNDQPSDILR